MLAEVVRGKAARCQLTLAMPRWNVKHQTINFALLDTLELRGNDPMEFPQSDRRETCIQ
jgi:hypothetical protein